MNLIVNKKSDRFQRDQSRIYDIILMFRSNMTPSDVHKIVTSVISFASSRCNSDIMYVEYWGLRPLSYSMGGNKKAHFYLLKMKIEPCFINDIRMNISLLNESIFRFLILKSSISGEKSTMLKNVEQDIQKEMGEMHYNDEFIFNI